MGVILFYTSSVKTSLYYCFILDKVTMESIFDYEVTICSSWFENLSCTDIIKKKSVSEKIFWSSLIQHNFF